MCSWNGLFASLLFINHWEYTRNVTWASTQAYPLLDGLNAWWSCFLEKVPDRTNASAYVYHDTSTVDPDNEHENQAVPDPQIGLALLRRTLSAQRDMAMAMQVPAPAYIDDILTHLAQAVLVRYLLYRFSCKNLRKASTSILPTGNNIFIPWNV